jgi:hypothetical protein
VNYETIKEQCEALDIWETLQSCLNNENANVQDLINQKLSNEKTLKEENISNSGPVGKFFFL